MQILLTNDDGIYAPGIRALRDELETLGDVCLVAPATEQSGVSHSITFLSPLICNQAFEKNQPLGWAVEGSPADCVRIGVFEFCAQRPDLVVSGINHGLNVGINVLYSGTVAAAIEGAFYGIDSVAVSLEQSENANFQKAASMARKLIEQILEKKHNSSHLYNMNIPTSATEGVGKVRVVPMGVARYGEQYIKRQDPKGRNYYWATSDPPPAPSDDETDLVAILNGHVTLTPLDFNMTDASLLEEMQTWQLSLQDRA